MTPLLRRTLTLLMVALLVAGFAVACDDDDDDGDGDETPAAETPTGDETPAGNGEIDISGIPELEDGVLNIGSDIAYAPIEFLDENDQPTGLDIDLANAIAEVLGVEAQFENSAFDGLIPALQAQRYDAIISAMTATEERAEQVDFIEYFNAGSGIVVEQGNPQNIQSAEDLCGKTVAVQEGTIQVDFLEQQNADCDEPIEILRFPTDPEAVQALLAGQADAEMADYPVAAYSAQQSGGEIEVVPNQIDPAPYGIAVRQDSDALEEALQQAFDTIVENGTYDQILEQWNLSAGSIEEA